MSQASPTYSPPEILQAGYKAEMDGRTDYAIQFYRHLTDYYPQTTEAAEARQALQRIDAAGAQARPLSLAPDSRRAAEGQAQAQARSQPGSPAQSGQDHQVAPARRAGGRPIELPTPVRGYWIGRTLAVLLMLASAFSIIGGAGLVAFGFAFGFERPAPGGFTPMIAGPSLLIAGIVLMLFSQLCLAMFRIALAASDLAAVTRATAEQQHGHE